MAIATDNDLNTLSSKSHKIDYFTHLLLRILAMGATVSSASIMLTNKQTTIIYGIQFDASYSYSPAFKFFAGANIAASSLAILSLIVVFVMEKGEANSTLYFFLFVHDLIITVLLMAGLSAATAISYVGKYGNTHAGWLAICDHFGKFCNKGMASLILGFIGIIVNLILTIFSADKSRKIKSSNLMEG